MTVALGIQCYKLGKPPSVGEGRLWTLEELEIAISGSITSIIFDDAGTNDIKNILVDVAETDFEYERLEEILADANELEDWRVGEAIAEAYLINHRACFFPWPDGRDERKRKSSLPGADLVGFRIDENGSRFSFGEVKTSAEAIYPPGTMYGNTGLKQQLEDLRDKSSIRNDLIKYLGHRARDASWKEKFKEASKKYLQQVPEVNLFGVLIRDVDPHEDDARVRVEKLARGCPNGTQIEILVIYLSKGSIAHLGTKVRVARKGGITL
jgi:hypothetical protein